MNKQLIEELKTKLESQKEALAKELSSFAVKDERVMASGTAGPTKKLSKL